MAVIKFDDDRCIGCCNCAEICPVGVWEMENGKAVLVRPDDCIECGACAEGCPEQCITLE